MDAKCAWQGALHADVFQGQPQRFTIQPGLFGSLAKSIGAQGKSRAPGKPILAAVTTTRSENTTQKATVGEMVSAAR